MARSSFSIHYLLSAYREEKKFNDQVRKTSQQAISDYSYRQAHKFLRESDRELAMWTRAINSWMQRQA